MNSTNTTHQDRNTLIALIGIMLFSILIRTVPALHLWPNFSPIAALALFSGALVRNKKWMFIFPIGAMLISDTILEITAPGSGFYADMVYVYASFFAILAIGTFIKNTKNALLILGASLAGSVLFFLVTNFGAWMTNNPGSQIIYTRDFAGLMNCYAAGLAFYKGFPFAGYTLVSDLFFNGLFFGAYYLFASRKTIMAVAK